MDVFVARQPIFDTKQKVCGYELLFRSGWEDSFPDVDHDKASARTISESFMAFGLEALTGGKRAFLNFTRRLLLSECATILPNDKVVLEILETITPDEEVLAACQNLKARGYTLALDDFVYAEEFIPLIQLADIIKIDFLSTTVESRRDLIPKLSALGIEIVAEKVETHEAFQEAVELGCKYMQGYFFSKPSVLKTRDIPTFKLNYIQMLKEIHSPGFDFSEMDLMIKGDLSLSYKLLKLINSAAFPWARRIESIHQALVLLGQSNVKKWASLIALTELAQDQPQELVSSSVLRAAFCESIGSEVGLEDRKEELFLIGMFSQIDAVLNLPLEEALDHLPLTQEIKDSLQGEETELKAILDLVVDYERARWDHFSRGAERLGLSPAEGPQLYRDAVQRVEAMQESYVH